MTGLAELQSGQVAFISGLLGGFALSIATQLLRLGFDRLLVRLVFVAMLLTTLLFLVALYIDVRLGIELAGVEVLDPQAFATLDQLRAIGTTAASAGFLLMLAAIGALGWLATPGVGALVSGFTLLALGVLGYAWWRIADFTALL